MGRTSVESPALAAVASRPDGASAGRPWWLWPHLLSLDAPLVALTWQDWLGRSVHDLPTAGQRLCLGLGVWLIYLADRLADNARTSLGDSATARHRFARMHGRALLALALVIALVLVGLAPVVLPPDQFHGGLLLLSAAGGYFWLIHRSIPPRWTRHVPKEAVVGGMFALGTAFFVLCRPAPVHVSLGTALALFGVACFLNCALITTWERDPRDRRDPASLLNAFPWLANGGLRTVCGWLAALSVAAGWGWRTALFLPVTLGAVALVALDAKRARLSSDALRCLVDVALLTPAICLGVAAVFGWTAFLFPP